MRKAITWILFIGALALVCGEPPEVRAQGYTETFFVCAGGDGTLPETATCATAWDCDDLDTAGNWDIDDSDDGKLGPNDAALFMDDGGQHRCDLDTHQPGTVGKPITIGIQSGDSPIISGSDLMTSFTQYGVWNDAFAPTEDGDNSGNNDINYRNAIDADTSSYDGIKVRITITCSTTSACEIGGTSIGVSTANDDYDSAPTRITWDTGNNGKALGVGGSAVSDEITFSFDKTVRHLVHDYMIDGDTRKVSSGTYGRGYGTGSDDTLTQTVAYTWDAGVTDGLTKLEVYTATANVWQKTGVTTQPRQVFFDGTKGNIQTSLGNVNSDKDWYWAANILYVYSVGNPDSTYTTPGVEASQRFSSTYGVINVDVDYITLENLTIQHANARGVSVHNGADYVILDNLTITHAYSACVQTTDDGGVDVTNITIQDGTFSYCGTYGISMCCDTTDSTASSNEISYSSWDSAVNSTAGLKMWGNGTNNLTIENNDIHDNGTGQAGARGVGIWVDQTGAGIIVRYNECYDNNYHGILVERTSGTSVYYNLSYSNSGNIYTAGIAVVGNDGGNANDNLIYNNTIYDNDPRGIWIYGDGITADCIKDNLIKNNIIEGSATVELLAHDGGDNAGTSGSGNVFSNNCLGAEYTGFVSWTGAGKNTYDDWETAYGGTTNSAEADPLFLDAASANFRLNYGSPAVDAGTDVSLTEDYEGKTVPYGSAPEIGAYELIPGSRRRFNLARTESPQFSLVRVADVSFALRRTATLTFSLSVPGGAIGDIDEAMQAQLVISISAYAVDSVWVGDIGTVFEIDVGEDISTATTKQIYFKKPNGATLTKTATFTTDGTDGKIEYTTVADDIDVAGTWQIQGRLVFGSNEFATAIGSFTAEARLVD
jgi:hypothetical protein